MRMRMVTIMAMMKMIAMERVTVVMMTILVNPSSELSYSPV
jgi:hypothetical protein